VKVNSFYLANYAEVRDSLVYSMGGFPEWWTVHTLPSVSTLAVVLVAELTKDELPTDHRLDLMLVRPSARDEGEQIASVQFRHAPNENADLEGPFFQPIVFNFGVEFREEGRHEFAVIHETHALAAMSVHAQLAPTR
jgi:hypothetical protein